MKTAVSIPDRVFNQADRLAKRLGLTRSGPRCAGRLGARISRSRSCGASDPYNASALPTVIVAVLTANTKLSDVPRNVLVKPRETKLDRDSVVNVSALLTINRSRLTEFVAPLAASKLAAVDRGLKRVLGL